MQAKATVISEYPDLMTIKHMCGVTGQSEPTLRKMCREHVLPSVRIGKRIYVPKAEFVKYIEEAMSNAQ